VGWLVDLRLFEQEGKSKHDDDRELMPKLLYKATKFCTSEVTDQDE
jgi:hypothetical protein